MAWVKINDEHLKSYADSIRYAKDGTEYTTTLERARAEIAQDNGYFADISEVVQSKIGATEPYDKNELAEAVNSLMAISIDPESESHVEVGIGANGFYITNIVGAGTPVAFGFDNEGHVYVTGGG